ncbi:MAG: DNA polymerase IV [Alphaproteobacteria bacterium]|nr:DNA polymerase IV [Alphaproteobacteria bacterium]
MDVPSPPGFCRDCLTACAAEAKRCPSCGSPRMVKHPELQHLAIAHIDCDAFYAAIEKRDNPELADKPVIVGGQQRGVVSTACYIARIHGVKSAMPMFQALKLCPQAVVVKPNMAKYAAAGKTVRELMFEFTPLVQPVSIDEAFLDLSGTEKLHGAYPALSLARLIKRIEKEVGITASVGLSHNKFLAKLASDLEKPKGFSVVGKAETLSFLGAKPVGAIWGVGKATQAQLAKGGVTMINQLQNMEKIDLMRRFGNMGARLYHLAHGEDFRDVLTETETKSVSSETTFNEDIKDYAMLESILWNQAQRVSRRAKASGLAGHTVNLKLKTKDFQTLTRAVSMEDATNMAHRIFESANPLLKKETGKRAFRLLGVGISHLIEQPEAADEHSLDSHIVAKSKAETAMDAIRKKFGNKAVDRGLGLSEKKT